MKKCGEGAVYGLGFIGSIIYFIQQANGLTEIIVGIIKSIFWPGVLAYELFKFLEL